MAHLALLPLVLGCRKPVDPATSVPVVHDLAWMVGSWSTDLGYQERWHDFGFAILGVAFTGDADTTGFYEVLVVHTDEGGGIVYQAFPAGDQGTKFRLVSHGNERVSFEAPEHDWPTWIRYTRKGDRLRADVGGPNPDGTGKAETIAMTSMGAGTAPELEAADRAFALDSAARGAPAWAAAWDDAGALWDDGRVVGPAAVEAALTPLFTSGRTLSWTPAASGLAPAGDLGFTVGNAILSSPSGEPHPGAYATIWKKQSDGTWKVWFDAGTYAP